MGNTFIIGAFTRPRCYSWLTPLATKSWTAHLITWPLFMCIFHIGKVGMIMLGRSLPWKYEAASFKTLQGRALHPQSLLENKVGCPAPHSLFGHCKFSMQNLPSPHNHSRLLGVPVPLRVRTSLCVTEQEEGHLIRQRWTELQLDHGASFLPLAWPLLLPLSESEAHLTKPRTLILQEHREFFLGELGRPKTGKDS